MELRGRRRGEEKDLKEKRGKERGGGEEGVDRREGEGGMNH